MPNSIIEQITEKLDDHQLFAKYIANREINSYANKKLKKELNILPEGHKFLCPISRDIMQVPVSTHDGQFTFDDNYIKHWLSGNQNNPLNRQPLTKKDLMPNTILKREIDQWLRLPKLKIVEISDKNSFLEQGGTETTWERYEIIDSQIAKGHATQSYKKTNRAISVDLLIKYHRQVFNTPEEDCVEILHEYEKFGLIERNPNWGSHEIFCKSKLKTFEKNLLHNLNLDSDKKFNLLIVKNMLAYEHENYQHDIKQEILSHVENPNEVKIKKLISYYTAETIGNIWWAQRGNRRQAFVNKYTPVSIGNCPKTIVFNLTRWFVYGLSDLFKLILFCPERIDAYTNFIGNPSCDEVRELLESGLLMALLVMIAMILESSVSIAVINYRTMPEYRNFVANPTYQTWRNLIKANPGIVGILLLSMGYGVVKTLKFATINWECEYAQIMSGDLKSAGTVFAKHPSTFGLMSLMFKELGYNNYACPQYKEFIKNPTCQTWCALIKANPGAGGFLLTSLGCSAAKTLKFATINWECEYVQILSGDLKTAGTAFTKHPSVLGLLPFVFKELGYNDNARPQYKEFTKNPTCQTWCDLIKANSGAGGFLLTSLGVSAVKTLKFVTINWECEYAQIMSGDLKTAGIAFAKHPSVFGLVSLVFKELGYNNYACSQYKEFIKTPSCQTWCKLVKANPGVGGLLLPPLGMSAVKVLKFATINWECEYAQIMSGDLKIAGATLAKHPSVFGLISLAFKELGYNNYACSQYKEFVTKPTCQTWCALIKANPGVGGLLLTSLSYSANKTLKYVTINWECEYAQIMSGDLKTAGAAFAKHPSIFGLMPFVFKEFGYNDNARPQYKEFLETPTWQTWCSLVKANPGVGGFLFTSLGYSALKILKKTFIDTSGMLIPPFKYLNKNTDYFEILRECNEPIQGEELYTPEGPLHNFNKINEKNYLKIKIRGKFLSQDLIGKLFRLGIAPSSFHTDVFNRFLDKPTSKTLKSMFRHGGFFASSCTLFFKAGSLCFQRIEENFRPDTNIQVNRRCSEA